MSISLQQGGNLARLSNVIYHQAEGFEESNVAYATEEAISAESDAALASGPATILHDEKSYSVLITVVDTDVRKN
ncbi:MAG: hypothetical protein QM796_20405 [Chthoniobacteraceae bacterium]